MKVFFYKGKYGNFLDKIICFFSRGIYSHAELGIKQINQNTYQCISSSPRDNGVRITNITIDEKWDTLEIPDSLITKDITEWYNTHKNKGYDYLGAIGIGLRAIPEDKNKMFCSEAIADIIGFIDGWRIDPNTLFSVLNKLKK